MHEATHPTASDTIGDTDMKNTVTFAIVAAAAAASTTLADTGAAMGTAVRAELTVTFAHLKLGHVTGQGAHLSGAVRVVDIGVPSTLRADHAAALTEADSPPKAPDVVSDPHGRRGRPGPVRAAVLPLFRPVDSPFRTTDRYS
jgi:hypothetical protein